ncbi:ATP-dependent nuclease [Proteus mirabilis]|nr:AAA family ATPase [Proteus mirabilis]
MIINKVEIKNYRCFEHLEVYLQKLNVIVGENNSGKSNFINALKLPLNCSSFDFSSKKLHSYDINSKSIEKFNKLAQKTLKNNKIDNIEPNQFDLFISSIPIVSISIQLDDFKDNFEKSIVRKWAVKDNNDDIIFKITYIFEPRDYIDFIQKIHEIVNLQADEITSQNFPIDFYDYKIISEGNNKQISYDELNLISMSIIDAERDDFSNSPANKSNNILTKFLLKELNSQEINLISESYFKFFDSIKDLKALNKFLGSDDAFKNIKNYLQELICVPNIPNLKHIISNITLAYGSEFLYQKGLGERNLVYIFLFFAYYKNQADNFNLCCIEEPEAHLGVNKLRAITDFIYKSINESNSLFQAIITTHSPSIINKLKIENLIAISNNKAITLSSFTSDLNNYLRKRPNFDILKILFANKLILVEGPTEEMLIRTFLEKDNLFLHDVEVVSIGQKGYKIFLDIWLKLNEGNMNKKIGIVRDYDEQDNAKKEHDEYSINHKNIYIETTDNYTLEYDLVLKGKNAFSIAKYFQLNYPQEDTKIVTDDTYQDMCSDIIDLLINNKADMMSSLCNAILDPNKNVDIELPAHLSNIIKAMK